MKIIAIVLLLCMVVAEGRRKIPSKWKSQKAKSGKSDTDFTCPAEWEESGRKCYYVEGGEAQWSDATYRCETLGGVQLVLDDQDDVDYLMSKNSDFDPATYGGYWLGCQDEEVEGQWQCGDSPNYWNSESDKLGLWDWNTDEPDGGTDENCLILDFGGKLSDVPCILVTTFNAAACEITKIPPTPPPACSDPLGMEDGTIEPSNIEASSVLYDFWQFEATNGRLNNALFWQADTGDENPWIRIDIGYGTSISGLVTQGGDMEYVSTIKVSTYLNTIADSEVFIIDDETGEPKVFDANQSGVYFEDNPVTIEFPQPVDARIVQIYPLTLETHAQMRIEVLGCKK